MVFVENLRKQPPLLKEDNRYLLSLWEILEKLAGSEKIQSLPRKKIEK